MNKRLSIVMQWSSNRCTMELKLLILTKIRITETIFLTTLVMDLGIILSAGLYSNVLATSNKISYE
jgi:hypothetical protein